MFGPFGPFVIPSFLISAAPPSERAEGEVLGAEVFELLGGGVSWALPVEDALPGTSGTWEGEEVMVPG